MDSGNQTLMLEEDGMAGHVQDAGGGGARVRRRYFLLQKIRHLIQLSRLSECAAGDQGRTARREHQIRQDAGMEKCTESVVIIIGRRATAASFIILGLFFPRME